jgi:hypothetical protein
MEKINGGFPPLEAIKKIKKNEKVDKKEFKKERFFAPIVDKLDIKNILESKKTDIMNDTKQNIEIIDSL